MSGRSGRSKLIFFVSFLGISEVSLGLDVALDVVPTARWNPPIDGNTVRGKKLDQKPKFWLFVTGFGGWGEVARRGDLSNTADRSVVFAGLGVERGR